MDGLNIPVVVGGVISLLLSIVAYFLHLLIQDIRQMRTEQRELRDLCIWLKAEQQNIRDWMQEKISHNLPWRKEKMGSGP